jgi:hypothetical protein
MSTRTLKANGIDCRGGICGLAACGFHTVEIRHNLTSDTVSIWLDGDHVVTHDDNIWCAILQLEAADEDKRLKEKQHG